jgi:hypothetical protein
MLTILTWIILIRDKINGHVYDNGRVYNDTTDAYTTATAVNIKIQRTYTNSDRV